MTDFEIGDIIFWVSIGGGKPFAVNVYRKNGDWTYQAHKELNDKQRIMIEGFAKDRIADMNELWKPNMKTRLVWDGAKK